MSDKKYIVSVVGVIKKNGTIAHAGEEVSADDFNNFEERVKGEYVKEKGAHEKAIADDTSTDAIKKAMAEEKSISVESKPEESKPEDKKELKKPI